MARKRKTKATFVRENYKPLGSLESAYRSSPANSRFALVERMYLRILREWSITRFQWKGMPDTVDLRFLESQLFEMGHVVFYYDYRYGRYMVVRAMETQRRNVYDNPTGWRTLDHAGYKGLDLKPHECVPIYASYTRMSTHDVVYTYARRLADLDISLEVTARNMRVNKLAVADESNRLTVMNSLRQIDAGEPVLFIQAGFDIQAAIQTLDLAVHPDILDRLRIEKNQVWNEAATMLGITNANQDKKERMIADEATGSDGSVLAARNSAMKPRLEACEMIRRLWPDVNVSVEWDYSEAITPGMDREHDGQDDMGMMGGFPNGNIYNGIARNPGQGN